MTSPSPIQPADNTSRPRAWLRRVAWCEPFWVLAIGFLLLLPQRFLPAVVQVNTELLRASTVAFLLIGGSLRLLAYGRLTRRTPLDWPVILMLAWLPVNFWASVDKADSWEALSPLLVGVALYLALLNWPPAYRRPQIIAELIVIMGVGLAFTAPLFSNLATDKLFRIPALTTLQQRLSGTLPGNVNANQIAGVLAVVIPVAAALALRRDWRTRRWTTIVSGLSTLFMLAMLALTQSRGAYVATAIALGVVTLLRWPKLWYAVPVVMIAGALTIGLLGPRTILEAVLSGNAVNGLNGRLELWSRAIYAISDFPITGIGVGTWNKVLPTLYPLFSVTADVKLTHAHNLLLQVSLDLGLPGFIAYLAMFANIIVLLIASLRQRVTAIDWALASGALGALTAMFIHGIVDVTLWNVKAAILPWLLIALSMLVGLRAAASAASQPQ